MTRRTSLLLAFLLIVSSASAQTGSAKFTRQLRDQLAAAPSQMHTVWLYLDSSARSTQPIVLTEHARMRRARVNASTLLIDRRDYPIRSEVIQSISSSGVTIRRRSRWLNAVSIEGTAEQIARAASQSSVVSADRVRTLTAPPKEPAGKDIRSLPNVADDGNAAFQNQFIKADRMHAGGLTGTGVMIAFFDSGFDTSHVAFDSTSIVAQYDFVQNDSDVSGPDCPDQPSSIQQDHHGTLTLGVVGGNDPNAMYGVAPAADFILAKTEITCGFVERKIEEDNWVAAAEWADSIGADIISSSLGYSTFQDSGSYTQAQLDGNTALITIAADAAAAKNILVVNSAGNDRAAAWGTIGFPADGDSVIAVGAVGPDSSLAGFSSPGPTADGRIKPDISTLGVAVYAPSATGSYTAANGTSLSTPLVTGGAALALEFDPAYTADDLRRMIRSTGSLADSPNNDFGYGLYDAYASADLVRLDMPSVITLAIGGGAIPIDWKGRAEQLPTVSLVSAPQGFGISGSSGMYELRVPETSESITFSPVVLAITDGRFRDTAQVTVVVRIENRVTFGPNPFRDSVIFYPANGWTPIVSVTIFTLAGEKVWEKVNNSTGSVDEQSMQWDGVNESGSRVAAGVYMAVIKSTRSTRTVKLLKLD